MPRRGYGINELRERLANEAARLISEHGIQDYGLAKRKAASRFGVRDVGALPANIEIEERVIEWNALFGPKEYKKQLVELRSIAAYAMKLLDEFEPRLVGAVLTGAITANSSIEIHLFTDAPEEVAIKLDDCQISYRNCHRRYRYAKRCNSLIPGFRFTYKDEQIDGQMDK